MPLSQNAVVLTICSCRNVVFLGLHIRMQPSTGFNKKWLSSDQCTLCYVLIVHPIWSRAHWSLAILWRIVSSRRFICLLARNLALLRRLLMVCLLMCPLTIHRLRSVFAVLNACCLVSLLMSLSALGVVFRSFPVLWCSFTLPVWFTHYFNWTITKWLHWIVQHSNCLPSLCISHFSTCHVEIKFTKFKVLPVLHVQILIWNPHQTWVS